MNTDTNINNTFEKPQEAQEVGSQSQAVSDGSANDMIVADLDNASQAPKKKWPWIVIIVVLGLLVIGGITEAIIWHSMQKSANDVVGSMDADTGSLMVGDDVEEEIVGLSVDDQLVQELFRRFGGSQMLVGSGLTNFYNDVVDSGLNLQMMLGVVMQKLLNSMESMSSENDLDVCKTTHTVEDFAISQAGEMSCFDGERIRTEIKTIFGKDVQLVPGIFDVSGTVWDYDVEADEVYFRGGKTGGVYVERALYAAEKDDSHIYLYEVVVQPTTKYFLGACEEYIAGQDDCASYKLDDTPVDVGVKLTADNLAQYKDVLDKVRWTFVNDGTGNYVFEKLEQL